MSQPSKPRPRPDQIQDAIGKAVEMALQSGWTAADFRMEAAAAWTAVRSEDQRREREADEREWVTR